MLADFHGEKQLEKKDLCGVKQLKVYREERERVYLKTGNTESQ